MINQIGRGLLELIYYIALFSTFSTIFLGWLLIFSRYELTRDLGIIFATFDVLLFLYLLGENE